MEWHGQARPTTISSPRFHLTLTPTLNVLTFLKKGRGVLIATTIFKNVLGILHVFADFIFIKAVLLFTEQ